MEKKEMQRIVQNLYDEAKENITTVAELEKQGRPLRGYIPSDRLLQRLHDIDEGAALIEELDKATPTTDEKALREACHRRIYVASSWKNDEQPGIVRLLRSAGHEVYDFRHPREGDDGFSWSEIDPAWKDWTPEQYIKALSHPAALRGFGLDWSAMEWADTGVLVLPCGKSAHLEAGYFVGAGKSLYILMLDQDTPELMYKMATVCTSEAKLIALLAHEAPEEGA